MFKLLTLFLVSKLFHLFHIGSILGGDLNEYRDKNSEIQEQYPSDDEGLEKLETDLSDDEGLEKLETDCYLVIGQCLGVMVVISISMILTKKTNIFIKLLPYLIALVQLCELPFKPIFPS